MSLLDTRAAKVRLLNAADLTVTQSDTVERDNYVYHAIQIVNAGGATVQIFVSIDNTHFIQYGANITGNAYIMMAPGPYPFIYVTRDGATSGTVTAWIASNLGAWL